MIKALTGCIAAVALCGQDPAHSSVPLTFDVLLAKARPDPGQLRLEAELAARERLLASTGGMLREAPTLTAESGRRSGPVVSSTDRLAQVDAPLLLAPGVHAMAQESHGRAQTAMLSLAKAESRHRLRMAYLETWLAMAQLRLRNSLLALTETWGKAAKARVDSGADPAFHLDLVRGDLARLRSERAELQRRATEAWAGLRAWVDLPAEIQPLADPGPTRLPHPRGLPESFQQSLIRRATTERAISERAGFELAQAIKTSRWALKGSYSLEGDERIVRVGVAVRLPRPGEIQAQRREEVTGRALLAREGEAAAFQLESRFQTALARLRSFDTEPAPISFEAALKAITVRLQEGKERPSDAIQLRRLLVEAENAVLVRHWEGHALQSELELLTMGDAR